MYDKYRVKYLHPLPAFVFFPLPCSIMPTEDFIADTRMQFVLTFSACFFHSKYLFFFVFAAKIYIPNSTSKNEKTWEGEKHAKEFCYLLHRHFECDCRFLMLFIQTHIFIWSNVNLYALTWNINLTAVLGLVCRSSRTTYIHLHKQNKHKFSYFLYFLLLHDVSQWNQLCSRAHPWRLFAVRQTFQNIS